MDPIFGLFSLEGQEIAEAVFVYRALRWVGKRELFQAVDYVRLFFYLPIRTEGSCERKNKR